MEIILSALGIAMTDLIQVGQKHTISEASPDLGTHSPGPASSNDEDAQAQKLGMGALADPGKGKS